METIERKGGLIGRRRVLALAGSAIAGGGAASGGAAASGRYQRWPIQRRNPVGVVGGALGGGEEYENAVPRWAADHVVDTRAGLERALSAAGDGDVVYVDGAAEIDLGDRSYTVPRGVTLASDRGVDIEDTGYPPDTGYTLPRGVTPASDREVDDAPGGLLYTDKERTAIYVRRDARVTGVRLRGPYPEYFDPSWYATGTGLEFDDDGVEVDNCEVWGFAYASIAAGADAHVHHNHVHHNARDGLGYGVVTRGGHPVIECNYFNYNRHSVASTGSHHGYTCRYNHFGPDAVGIAIDMHSPGGVRSEVHNNVVEATEDVHGDGPLQGLQVRGVPDETFDVHDNWFYNSLEPRDSPAGLWTDEAIIQPTETAWRNVEFSDNRYGLRADLQTRDFIPGYGGDYSPPGG